MMKKGFTLVELSIVLVIIGLLIGGILVSQSMIQTVKIQRMIRDLQQYDILVSNFQMSYKTVPGDSSAFGCVGGTNRTCDNGVIEDGMNTTVGQTFEGETANFWPQLNLAGFQQNGANFSATIATTFDTTSTLRNGPKIPLGPSGATILAITYNSWGGWGQSNYFYITNMNGATASSHYINSGGLGAMRNVEALAIDTKMDDGVATTGVVLATSAFCNYADPGRSAYTCPVSVLMGGINGMR